MNIFNSGRSLASMVSAALVAAFIFTLPGWVEWVDASDIVVIQSPTTGNLRVVFDPGPTWQGWGTVTTYPRRKQTTFQRPDTFNPKEPISESNPDPSIRARFNDGGHANVSGLMSWEMPLTQDAVIRLHRTFHSAEGIENQLIKPAITKSFYQTSPLMSSTESYASRRSEFLQIFEDQIQHGVYRTRTISIQEPDPITNLPKTVSKVEVILGANGQPARQEGSAFEIYKIGILPATISAIDYDPDVEAQIKQQRDATLQVQSSQANAKKAEQDAITAKLQGEAKAATARAEQEAVKAIAVTQAERDRDVAKLKQEAAGYTKQESILLGEGEAERKRLVMNADGALERKLDAYMRVNQMYANAMANYKGQWVPTMVLGGAGNGNSTGGGATDLLNLLTAKTARDLNLDLSLPSNKR